MDDRELAERLTNIETKINLLLESEGYEYNDDEGYIKPSTKKEA